MVFSASPNHTASSGCRYLIGNSGLNISKFINVIIDNFFNEGFLKLKDVL